MALMLWWTTLAHFSIIEPSCGPDAVTQITTKPTNFTTFVIVSTTSTDLDNVVFGFSAFADAVFGTSLLADAFVCGTVLGEVDERCCFDWFLRLFRNAIILSSVKERLTGLPVIHD
jgi:hypothetical protein